MKVRQINVRVFELNISNKLEAINFIKKNIDILKKYLLNLKGEVDNEIEERLKKNNISYVKNLDLSFKKSEEKVENSSSNESRSNNSGLKIIDFVVRSGQEIIDDGSLIFFKRINSGAFIHCQKEFLSLDVVEGMVVCNGSFMLIKTTPKAKVFFNGVYISEQINDNKRYKIRFKNNEIEIKEYKGF